MNRLMRRNIAFSLILIIGVPGFILVVSEFILKALAGAIPTVAIVLRRADIERTVEDPKLGWRPNPLYPEHDRNGFRNEFVPNEASVVALGDSQTYGVGVASEQAWPKQLATLGKMTTYTMAYGGWGPTQSLILLDKALRLKPKLIIEAFYFGNDLYDSYYHVYEMKKLPELQSTDHRVIQTILDAEKIEPLTERILKLYQVELGMPMPKKDTAQKQPEKEHGALREFLAEHSELYGLARAVKRAYQQKNNLGMFGKQDWESIKKQALRNQKFWEIFDNEKVRTVFNPVFRLIALDLDDPRIAEGLRICLEAIRLMKQRSQTADIRFAVLLVPTKEMVFKNVVYENPGAVPETYKELMRYEEMTRQKILRFLQDQQIDFIDPLPALQESLQTGNQPFPISLDGHLNAIGHHAIAAVVLSEIEKHDLLRKREIHGEISRETP
jgi:hypothetical protein